MSDQRPVRVLLVEDSPDDARLITTLLERRAREPFEIHHCDRLGRGVSHLDGHPADVVLLDFSLPDSHGLETFRRMNGSHPEVPVIVLTSLEDDALAACAVREGAQDYLVKRDVDVRLLTRSIRYAMERHRADEALRRSEQRYALAVQGANDGLWDWDVSEGTVYLSPRWREMLGCADAEVEGSFEGWMRWVHPEDRDSVRSALDAHFRGGGSHFELEHRMLHRSEQVRWVRTRGVVVREADGVVVRMAGSMTDVTDRKRAEEQLLHDAFHDGLTGLANRALLVDRMNVSLAAQRRDEASPFAVLVLDVDRFKNVNDSLGHGLGDELLLQVGQRLKQVVREGDTVARLGGDEFAVQVNRVRDAGDAVHLAERIKAVLGQPFSLGEQEVFVTASVGIALSADGATSADGMLRDADIAMYRAKGAGRARYEIFDRKMHRAAVRLLSMETELRRAVDQGDFVMHYQPIVSLDDGRIVGFEALVRWNHPERGLVAPTAFIAIAEETGLIVPLGWWVLEHACRQARQWQLAFPSEPPLFMSVNVSGKLFTQADAVDGVVRILEASQLEPESLRLEVTESVVMEHTEQAMRKLLELRAFGVQLSIDDFGTGYSSLSYLQRFRYDSLKIDRSFVSSMGSAGDSRAIVETILGLASSLGIGVVAEGVETAEQVERLRQMKCPLGQGYWFARPLAVPAAEELLASEKRW
jgi:diguanylate cyclase (GGDEF)-like protein/PAS domain S-box-containing protein